MDKSLITKAHSATSYFASRRSPMMRIVSAFFAPEHRRAAHAVYAFFRIADDLVDEGHVSLAQFHAWQRQSRLPIDEQTDLFFIAWIDIRMRYQIDLAYEQAVLDGLELDLLCHRYKTMDELRRYCYGVAIAPFLLAMSIVGFRSGVTLEDARPYIENIGMAVQLTDIIRDVGEDLSLGRIYLPERELANFDLTYANIEARDYSYRFKNFMQYFADIARSYYVAGWPILDLFSDKFRLAGGCGMVLNRILLDEVEKEGFNVFVKQKIPISRRLWLLTGKWPAIYSTKSVNRYFR